MSTQTAVQTGRMTGQEHIDWVEQYAAHNYHPLPVVVAKADGVWVEDVDGKRYMDMLAAYSAVNFGHCHPELIAAAKVEFNKDGRVEVESFGTQPLRLLQVRSSSATLSICRRFRRTPFRRR